jgi:hypothetical protein
MSDTSEAGAKKGKGKGAKAGTKAKSKVGAKAVRTGLRGWAASADGASVSRTNTYESPEKAAKAGARALSLFQKNSKPVEVRLEGASMTLRLATEGGRLDDNMKKLAKRFAPKDPEAKAARRAARSEAGADAE